MLVRRALFIALFLAFGPGADHSQDSEDEGETRAGLRLSLLFDTSSSIDNLHKVIPAVGITLIESLDEREVAQIMTIRAKVDFLSRFTSDRVDLAKALREIRATGGTTSLYNALFIALKRRFPSR